MFSRPPTGFQQQPYYGSGSYAFGAQKVIKNSVK